MRIALIAGVVLCLVGAYVVFEGVSYTREESVIKLDGLEAKMQQKHHVPEGSAALRWAPGSCS